MTTLTGTIVRVTLTVDLGNDVTMELALECDVPLAPAPKVVEAGWDEAADLKRREEEREREARDAAGDLAEAACRAVLAAMSVERS